MSINATLLGQMITFAVFIWFTMKYVWPPMVKAMRERQKTITDGLQAAEEGQRKLELAERQAGRTISDAKLEGAHIIEHANERAMQIVEEAKEQARQESKLLLENAARDVQQQTNQAREALRQQVVDITLLAAEKILTKEVDKTAHEKALAALAEEL
ncbi:MAG: F0F1 ATP synthase subunit B [Gammaproteobacteria bacterium]|nr:F0F1 ATP synthase subunit B [Gammaproteobacteria bacterium]MCP4473558.1 F0F1 ATP synthase subunit B [Gammaproteobacteria bacterium]